MIELTTALKENSPRFRREQGARYSIWLKRPYVAGRRRRIWGYIWTAKYAQRDHVFADDPNYTDLAVENLPNQLKAQRSDG